MGEKLVRDRIPELIREKGKEPSVRKVSGDELDKFLRAKVVEEAKELMQSGDLEEAIDLLEVLEAFLNHRSVDRALLELQRQTKKHTHGAFEDGLVLDLEE